MVHEQMRLSNYIVGDALYFCSSDGDRSATATASQAEEAVMKAHRPETPRMHEETQQACLMAMPPAFSNSSVDDRSCVSAVH